MKKITRIGLAMLVLLAVGPSLAGDRTLSVVSTTSDACGRIVSASLALSAASDPTVPSVLYVGHASTDAGSNPRDWANLVKVAVLPGSCTSYEYRFPVDWGDDNEYVRFFLLDGFSVPFDTCLEYVAANGTYVDTSFIATGKTGIALDYAPSLDTECILCARDQGGQPTFTLFYIANAGWRFDYLYTSGSGSHPATSGTSYNVKINGGVATVGNDTIASYTRATYSLPNDPLVLFAARNGTARNYMAKGKLYAFKAWTNCDDRASIALDLLPAKINNVVGLYNKADGSFLTSNTSTALTAGPETTVTQPSVLAQTDALTGRFGAERTLTIAAKTRDASSCLAQVDLAVTAGNDRYLYACYANSECGTNLDAWTVCDDIGVLPGATNAYVYAIPTARRSYSCVRFFLTEKPYVPCDRQLAYVTATGSQYVDLDFVPTDATKLEMDIAFSTVASSVCLFCARGTGYVLMSYTGFFITPDHWRFDYNNQFSDYTPHTPVAGTKYSVETSLSGLKVDGEVKQPVNLQGGAFTAAGRMVLFASHQANTGYANYFTGNLYGFTAWTNRLDAASKIRDLVPCEVGGVPQLYDVVSKRYFCGSSALVAGEEVAKAQAVAASQAAKVAPQGFFVIVE